MTSLKRKLGALDIKQAIMADQRFRDLFPELRNEIIEIQRDPTCACNRKHLDKFFQYKDRLETYFPNRVVETIQEKVEQLSRNQWTVINCHINELEGKLRKLAPTSRRQLEVARYQDQVTVVMNELDFLY